VSSNRGELCQGDENSSDIGVCASTPKEPFFFERVFAAGEVNLEATSDVDFLFLLLSGE
jgi:hypothetical protein